VADAISRAGASEANALQLGFVSIVTKTGDKGETSLMYGRRLSKADPRVDAYGCVDELSAALGLARSIATDKFLSDQVLAAQRDLIVVMGELATAPSDRERYAKDGFSLTTTAMVDRITSVVFDLEKDKSLYPKDWVVPGGTPVSAALDFARTTCRRAERHIAASSAAERDFNSEILRYLNRLSDLCWVLARYAEKRAQPSR
jgi:cob(I)alamin adenosyltransferase